MSIKNEIVYVTWPSTKKVKQTLLLYDLPFKGIGTKIQREIDLFTDIKE